MENQNHIIHVNINLDTVDKIYSDVDAEDLVEEYQYDSYYYGKITSDISVFSLVIIMTEGICKFQREHMTDAEVAEILDGWFERDSNTDQLFDHKIPVEEFEDFIKLVCYKLECHGLDNMSQTEYRKLNNKVQ